MLHIFFILSINLILHLVSLKVSQLLKEDRLSKQLDILNFPVDPIVLIHWFIVQIYQPKFSHILFIFHLSLLISNHIKIIIFLINQVNHHLMITFQ